VDEAERIERLTTIEARVAAITAEVETLQNCIEGVATDRDQVSGRLREAQGKVKALAGQRERLDALFWKAATAYKLARHRKEYHMAAVAILKARALKQEVLAMIEEILDAGRVAGTCEQRIQTLAATCRQQSLLAEAAVVAASNLERSLERLRWRARHIRRKSARV